MGQGMEKHNIQEVCQPLWLLDPLKSLSMSASSIFIIQSVPLQVLGWVDLLNSLLIRVDPNCVGNLNWCLVYKTQVSPLYIENRKCHGDDSWLWDVVLEKLSRVGTAAGWFKSNRSLVQWLVILRCFSLWTDCLGKFLVYNSSVFLNCQTQEFRNPCNSSVFTHYCYLCSSAMLCNIAYSLPC